jgi:hypothetical protein
MSAKSLPIEGQLQRHPTILARMEDAVQVLPSVVTRAGIWRSDALKARQSLVDTAGQPGKSNGPSELRTDKSSGSGHTSPHRGGADLRNVYSLDVFCNFVSFLKKVLWQRLNMDYFHQNVFALIEISPFSLNNLNLHGKSQKGLEN